MSQLGGTGATIGNNLTAWNRTPGKPGTGTGQTVFPPNRWASNNNNKGSSSLAGEGKRDVNMDGDPNASSSNLWPSLFDSQRMNDVGPVDTTSQWTTSAFPGSNTATLLSSTSDPTHHQAINPSSSSTGWSDVPSTSSNIPRAITGQQPINHHQHPHHHHPQHSTAPGDTDPSRRFLGTNLWPLSSESSDLLNDESSQLSMALSKMNMGSSSSTTGPCFQPIHDFSEPPPPLLPSSVVPGEQTPIQSTTEANFDRANTSLDNAEIESLFSTDPEEAARAVINTTKPWGLRPVDQSTPWDTSELPPETANDPNNPFDGSQQSRRLESNVWPSEPPNGTGIWEAYYENLGERTARWQQNAGGPSTIPGGNGVYGANQQTGLMGGPAGVGRGHDLNVAAGGGSGSFRNFMRPNMGPLLGNSKPMMNAAFHGAPSPTNSTRGFQSMSGNSGAWPFSPNQGADPVMGGKGRWPNNPNFNRLAGKHQPPVAHLLGQGGNGMRWPSMNNNNNSSNQSTGWPMTDPRRPHMMPGQWGPATGDHPQNFFSPSGHPIIPPPNVSRMCQPGNEFAPHPLLPPGAAASRAGGGANQAFRLSHSAFYPSAGQQQQQQQSRAFLSPQQHSQQLQQQSVLRANAMRQLIQLGFPDEEVQAIFSDINTNVERALMDLRDRTCHPGLDEIIRSFSSGNLLPPFSGQDENLNSADLMMSGGTSVGGGVRSMAMRSGQPQQQQQHPNAFDQTLSKTTNNLPNENIDMSIHMLQQREAQVLQTIVQLQSKHHELNQRLAQIRSTNMPFATNHVMQELQLQAIQVASQADAQHAQLKQIRSQAGMLKQLAAVAAVQPSNSAFTPSPSGMWPGGNPAATSAATPVMCAGTTGQSPQLTETGMEQHLDPQDSGLKLGSGSFMWETGPWSGPGPRSATTGASFDSYPASAVDRRWSSSTAFPTRPPFGGALGDPRWSELASDSTATLSSNLLCTDADLPADDNRRVGSRSWLLAHNIPPHVSVSILKMAVSTALAKHAKSNGDNKPVDLHQLDFELHPNMSARWVLIGLASPGDAAVVQEYLESSGGEQNGAHYGSVKAISPSEALLRLQDIQSLASRFKAFSTADGVPSSRPLAQSNPAVVIGGNNFAPASSDYPGPEAINRPVGETN